MTDAYGASTHKGCSPLVGRTPYQHTGIRKGVSPAYFTEGCPAGDPDRGPFFIARWSRHAVPKTPGLLRYAICPTPVGVVIDGGTCLILPAFLKVFSIIRELFLRTILLRCCEIAICG